MCDLRPKDVAMVRYACLIAAIVLLAASALKFEQLVFQSVVESNSSIPAWFSLLIISIEVCVALMLLFSKDRTKSLGMAAGLFIVFVFWNLRSLTLGEVDCGCLGRLPSRPLPMLIFDIAMVALTIFL